MIFLHSTRLISTTHTSSTQEQVAPIPVKAQEVKLPVLFLNFIKPVVGIAVPAVVGVVLQFAHTPVISACTAPCDIMVHAVGTFPLPPV